MSKILNFVSRYRKPVGMCLGLLNFAVGVYFLYIGEKMSAALSFGVGSVLMLDSWLEVK